MSEALYQQIAGIVSKETKIPLDLIKPDADFATLGMDSLDSNVLLAKLEEVFDISIPDEEARKMKNVREVSDYLIGAGIVTEQKVGTLQ